jgi:FixJ family two-component response regulator
MSSSADFFIPLPYDVGEGRDKTPDEHVGANMTAMLNEADRADRFEPIASNHMVYAVDDDYRLREALHDLLEANGFDVVTFGAAADYLRYERPPLPACLILDVGLPDISGLDLQMNLAGQGHPRIVFITGFGDIPSSVRACKAGAVDFLTKPFTEDRLLQSVREALDQDWKDRGQRAALAELHHRLDALTPRERQVLPLVVSGLLNKQAAALLGISEVTLQIHRSKIMHKLDADSLATLVRMADALGVPSPHSRRGVK